MNRTAAYAFFAWPQSITSPPRREIGECEPSISKTYLLTPSHSAHLLLPVRISGTASHALLERSALRRPERQGYLELVGEHVHACFAQG